MGYAAAVQMGARVCETLDVDPIVVVLPLEVRAETPLRPRRRADPLWVRRPVIAGSPPTGPPLWAVGG